MVHENSKSKSIKFGGKTASTPAGAQQFIVGYAAEPADFRKLITISAFGKGTNALEYLYNERLGVNSLYLNPKDFYFDPCKYFLGYSESLCKDEMSLFEELWFEVTQIVKQIHSDLKREDKMKLKARLLAQGEIISVALISHALKNRDVKHAVLNAQHYIFADHSNFDYCNAKVNRTKTKVSLSEKCKELAKYSVVLIPGFIGRDNAGDVVNICRDGSDHTAALISVASGLEEVTLCKDVHGVFRADTPRDGVPISFITTEDARGCVVNETGTLVSLDALDLIDAENMRINIAHFSSPEKVGTIIRKSSTV